MTRHPVELQIERADLAINREDFDTLMDIYSEDAVLVVKPGVNAVGKIQIRKAMRRAGATRLAPLASAPRRQPATVGTAAGAWPALGPAAPGDGGRGEWTRWALLR